ncbi:MAG: CDP-diacylglycerol--serine O-phosphatidyltransferase, partial [Selenomonadaceae bacterium]|nr:CDP-diacylglycerol--serine O-phosphatidyltransferase [Selenomonadaceae bacterium]
MLKHLIPNACTSANLFFGMCSILSTFQDDLFMASVFILLALVADGLDGRTARFFGVSSELGKEMDSLCDLGSFGVAPAILAYKLCLSSYGYFGWLVAIFFALCGMWRLARFNVNTDVVHGYFMGLAIPAGGCIVASTTLLFTAFGIQPQMFGYVYPVSMAVVAYLMVSHVHYPDFKGDGE